MANRIKVVTGVHRVAYVHLKEPHAFEDGADKKYSVTLIIPKNHPDVEKIKKAINDVYAANKESMFKGTPMRDPNFGNPIVDGDIKVEADPSLKEFEGCYLLTPSSADGRQPAVFDSDKQEIFDLDEVYSGCYCRAVIVCSPYNKVKKGIKFYLNSVMKIKDGERLGGFAASADDYDDDMI